ncbi:MAG: hypothetical protein BJ554DRAFT_3289 [Olpidium bornovanus]|uniref:Secreted protein n=1 Tax=Olpidium bornovanus TaxID=278681 RepID=A0A8H8A0T2_9FUNG|nr:MAG: hypothetical protein BJ554DRAFT_3289 [Olpidium bornovanus]
MKALILVGVAFPVGAARRNHIDGVSNAWSSFRLASVRCFVDVLSRVVSSSDHDPCGTGPPRKALWLFVYQIFGFNENHLSANVIICVHLLHATCSLKPKKRLRDASATVNPHFTETSGRVCQQADGPPSDRRTSQGETDVSPRSLGLPSDEQDFATRFLVRKHGRRVAGV